MYIVMYSDDVNVAFAIVVVGLMEVDHQRQSISRGKMSDISLLQVCYQRLVYIII